MIVWLNGAFGAGKTTLSQALAPQLPDSMIFDPEEIGFALRRLVPPPATGDFQDLPIWRSMTRYALLEVRRIYQRPIVVPMTLVHPGYLTEILGGLTEHGEQVVHVYLNLPADVLRSRIQSQVLDDADVEHDEQIRQWRLAQVDRCLAALPHLPAGTHILDSGQCRPADLATQVLHLVRQAAHV